jgi:hypothetical protein
MSTNNVQIPTGWTPVRLSLNAARGVSDEAAVAILSTLDSRWVEWDGTIEAYKAGAQIFSSRDKNEGHRDLLLSAEGRTSDGKCVRIRRNRDRLTIWTLAEVREGGEPAIVRVARHLSNLEKVDGQRVLPIEYRVYARGVQESFAAEPSDSHGAAEPTIVVWRPWVSAFLGFGS